jgi:Tfp pilus assembly protein PilV
MTPLVPVMRADETARREEAAPDAGLSLVELLVGAFVGAVVLAVVATVFVSTLQADAAARDRDLATGRLQAVSTSLSTSIRAASAVRVESAGAVVRARVADPSGAWMCRAWAVVDLSRAGATGAASAGADGRTELRVTSYPPLPTGTAAPAPALSWGVLADDVSPVVSGATALPFFAYADDLGRLRWNLVAASATQPAVSAGSTASISGAAVARAFQAGGPRCW